MPEGIGYPDEQTLTNSAIDDLLEDDPRRKRINRLLRKEPPY